MTGFAYRIALALAAAVLLAAGQPPRLWWPATLAGLVAFLVAIRGLRPRPAFWLGLTTGTITCGLSVPWFTLLFHGVVPYAIFVLFGLFYALFAAVSAWLAPRIRPACLTSLWIAACWIAVEYYRAEWFLLRYPWVTPGVSLGPTWLLPLVGVYGQSFVVVLAAAQMANRNWRTGGLLAATIAALALIRPAPVAPAEPIRVAAVQYEDCDLLPQLDLALSASNRPQAMVWPEEALLHDPRDRRRDFARLTDWSAHSGCVLVLGIVADTGGDARDWRNTALTLDGTNVVGTHVKNRPVHLFNDGTPGTTALPAATRLGRIATPICFDCDYAEVTRRMTAAGAELFMVPSRDPAPWGDLQRVQHALFARLRALECGRWFVVAGSAGITQIVDPHGRVHGALPPYQPGVLCGTASLERHTTPYIAAGWLLPWLLTAAAGLGGVWAALRRPPTPG